MPAAIPFTFPYGLRKPTTKIAVFLPGPCVLTSFMFFCQSVLARKHDNVNSGISWFSLVSYCDGNAIAVLLSQMPQLTGDIADLPFLMSFFFGPWPPSKGATNAFPSKAPMDQPAILLLLCFRLSYPSLLMSTKMVDGHCGCSVLTSQTIPFASEALIQVRSTVQPNIIVFS